MQLLHNLEETLFVVLVLVLMTMKTELKSNSQGAVNSEGEGFNLIVWQIESNHTDDGYEFTGLVLSVKISM